MVYCTEMYPFDFLTVEVNGTRGHNINHTNIAILSTVHIEQWTYTCLLCNVSKYNNPYEEISSLYLFILPTSSIYVSLLYVLAKRFLKTAVKQHLRQPAVYL